MENNFVYFRHFLALVGVCVIIIGITVIIAALWIL